MITLTDLKKKKKKEFKMGKVQKVSTKGVSKAFSCKGTL